MTSLWRWWWHNTWCSTFVHNHTKNIQMLHNYYMLSNSLHMFGDWGGYRMLYHDSRYICSYYDVTIKRNNRLIQVGEGIVRNILGSWNFGELDHNILYMSEMIIEYNVPVGWMFSAPEVGGVNFFHASLANIFNKCFKKAVFKKKKIEFGYKLNMSSKGVEFF